jgi:phenylpropionate dioxygenase-like ring-hydroxylating dioxygenase large terminal subunit
MIDKFQKLHITFDNICELNHFVYTYSQMKKMLGREYSTVYFHSTEDGAVNDPWKYQINKHGYRGNNWTFNKDAIAFFGCSVTFGIGVEKDIATVVQENIKTECCNIGQPGASAINILKTFNNFIQYFPVKTAIITLPTADRIHRPEFNDNFSSWSYTNLIPNWINPNNKELHHHAYSFFSNDTCLAYLYDYIKMAELTAKVFDVKIIWSSWNTETLDFLRSIVHNQKIIFPGHLNVDTARDNLHPGPIFVKNWSDIIINNLS